MAGSPYLFRLTLISLAGIIYSACLSPTIQGTAGRVRDLPTPPGYGRPDPVPGTYAAWLGALPLKHDPEILLHTGRPLRGYRYRVLAVVDKPLLFRENLEECVDFCLRLWADYHREAGMLDHLYLFNNRGQKVYFKDYATGTEGPSFGETETTYRVFLKNGLAWTNPYAVTLGANHLSPADIRPGDCIIQTAGRYRGQASLILDECDDGRGKRLFLIGFGFSPAQEFHIEKAPTEYGAGGWFSLEGYIRYLDRYYRSYGKPGVYRF